jgi:RimJ/RimL family protein N-acetyltransferase
MMLEGILVDLVPYDKSFREHQAAWMNNDSQFWTSRGDRWPVSKASIERWYEESRSSEKPDMGLTFGLRTKDGTPIGSMGFNWIWPHHRMGMMGASIGEPDYWGGGYGTDGLLLLLDYAFLHLDLRRVWLGTMSLNERVVRQMEKVGFKLEARRRELVVADGRRYDELVYGLLRSEWPGRQQMIDRLGLKPR